MAAKRILILGSAGQVGWELQRSLMPLGRIVAASRCGRYGPMVDLTNIDSLTALLDRESPDLIVNAAAYTAVDKAESEPELAHRINAEAPGAIGRWAKDRGRQMIHYSTDYVFDGEKEAPYVETDPPNPLGVYGRTKLAGDEALLASGAAVVILRVSWVYGLRGNNFLRTMRRLLEERDSLRIVDDQFGAPNWSRAIAEATAFIGWRLLNDPELRKEIGGLYHLSPVGETSWYGFAAAIREAAQLNCELVSISTSEYPTAAQRPRNSRMNSDKVRNVFNLELPDWKAILQVCMSSRE